ncbi:MAG TPA: HD domain-containing protein [Blastocatellia bacterium]|nr:HD domain-containing protein [Blastocatellia bacterium]
MTFNENDIALILKAVRFSADKHRNQRRKGSEDLPYVNHPIEVAETLWRVGRVRDINVIVAAILHDTIEDTDTTPEEIEAAFGSEVLSLVREVSDDKSLPKQVRKQLQIDHAAEKSPGAKQIKLADKLSNIRDVTHAPPADWSLQRRTEYLDWADKVVAGLRGCNRELENRYDEVMKEARMRMEEESPRQ